MELYYIRDADMNLAKIPEGVTLEQAVMVPDMMCTAFEGVQALNMKFGQSVAVLGVGPVGLMAVRAAVLQGAGNVFAIGSRQVCFDVAKEYGATHLIDYHNEDYIDQIVRGNGGPVDNVVLCGGSEKELSLGLKMLKNGGTLVNLSAYFSNASIPIQPAVWGFGYGDKTIKGVGCGGGTAPSVPHGPAHRQRAGGPGEAYHPPLPRHGADSPGHGPVSEPRPEPDQTVIYND